MIKGFFKFGRDSKSSHDGFLVKQHRPLFKWLMLLLTLVLLVISFFAGQWEQERTLRQSYDMIQELNASISQLTERNNELVRNNAQLSAGSKVDRDAYNSVNNSLINLQSEILLLKEELVFYRGIVSPTKTDYGIKLQELNLSKGPRDNEYRYKVILTKVGRSKYSVKGELTLSVEGLVDGKTKAFKLNELSEEKIKSLSYSFRYFQIFEGIIKLPEQFYPEAIKVDIKSKTKNVKSIKDTLNWAELVSGDS